MSLVKPKHINLYRKYITQLITDLGQSVTLCTENTSTPCPNCIYDTIHKCSSGKYKTGGTRQFTSGAICPVCKGKGIISTITRRDITCTVNWGSGTTAEEKTNIPAGTEEKNIFHIKSVVAEYDNINNANYLLIDGVRSKVLTIYKRGLKEDVVCVAVCQRDD